MIFKNSLFTFLVLIFNFSSFCQSSIFESTNLSLEFSTTSLDSLETLKLDLDLNVPSDSLDLYHLDVFISEVTEGDTIVLDIATVAFEDMSIQGIESIDFESTNQQYAIILSTRPQGIYLIRVALYKREESIVETPVLIE